MQEIKEERQDKFNYKKGDITVVKSAEEAERIKQESDARLQEALRKAGLL